MEVAVIILIIFFNTHLSVAKLEDDVSLQYYVGNKLRFVGKGSSKDSLQDTGCKSSDKFAFIVHGWTGSCNQSWPKMLRSKLTEYRGGCIICIDYAKTANSWYIVLLPKFNFLVEIMTRKLKDLFDQGVDPSKTYLFGFSFGGQLVIAIGHNFKKKIQDIDVCDAAGFGFDGYPLIDHRNAGHNVQCIHTSIIIGTGIYTCHQDWRMGLCGIKQPFERTSSHSYCPLFYISAFENPFYAIEEPGCGSKNPVKVWPKDFKMGYTESRKSQVTGELFAFTREKFPYNVLPKKRNESMAHKLDYDSVIIFIGFIFNLFLLK